MNKFQFLVALTASFGGLLFGYEVGVMNVVLVMDAFRIFFKFHSWNGDALDENGKDTTDKAKMMYRKLTEAGNKATLEGIITSSFVLGALCGALMATYLGEKYGRQRTIMIGACIFTCGAVIQGLSARSWIMIAVGRLITGLSIGCNGVLCPTYISEVAPAKIRGTLSSCYQLMTTFGIIVAAIINSIVWYYTNSSPAGLGVTRSDIWAEVANFEWRFALLFQVVPGLGLAILMSFLPKSPRWLCSKDRDEEAVEVLAKLNATSTSDELVQSELKAIQEDVAATRAAGSSSFGELFSPVIRRRTFITFLMQLFQQWTGINVIMYYQSQIYDEIGFSKFMSTVVLPIINNFVNFVSTFPGMWGIERLGRKTLLVVGSLMMMVFHVSTWACSTQTNNGKVWQYLAVASVFLFVFSFAWTWGPVPWVYQAEVFPLRVRVKGSAVGTVSNFLNNWIIAFVGPALMKAWSTKTFLLFAAACLLAWVYSQFYVIECKGLSIDEMDAKMAGKA
ncbi:general substrate transporter [Neocallimastix lanati (nom. inval.)]|uniref:General substrate transporter n=1 Tax=Neocallimastix californiae TaxID=1754190 RepID=A0A1Y2DB83_9FUNG|nr:general substrate transporter [Neocallimastix sp. JGI-2020a]KAG4103131.1 general substrate transporter [Neocallimastix sp. JGI-2020a]KAG4103133.1 general substrate transporter [Neocallimastix sp. JGI-2020a]ORY56519.1 general substrate transporter [Neocallimastix californiae]ORY56520.1 general substrate transporter [Neocallimastix californiae]|eukprot:ORY56519.1 general substrate transporter [Neocallimastix californiae]